MIKYSVFLATFLLIPTFVDGQKVEMEDLGITIEIPENWKEIPDDWIVLINDHLAANYTAGLMPRDAISYRDLDKPFIYISFFANGGGPKSAPRSELENLANTLIRQAQELNIKRNTNYSIKDIEEVSTINQSNLNEIIDYENGNLLFMLTSSPKRYMLYHTNTSGVVNIVADFDYLFHADYNKDELISILKSISPTAEKKIIYLNKGEEILDADVNHIEQEKIWDKVILFAFIGLLGFWLIRVSSKTKKMKI